MSIAALFTIDKTWKQPKRPSTRLMDKVIVVHIIYTMECYSATKRNIFESVLVRWINLEPITQNEIKSEREKRI